MKKIQLTIEINTARETIWQAIVDPENYRKWAVVFHEGSFFEGGWNKGDTIRFLMVNKSGKKEGMVAEIEESIYPEFISIKHLGYVNNGVDDTSSNDIKTWAPAYENYSLSELAENKTLFSLEQDVTDDYYNMFMDLWPKAMNRLKEICENIESVNSDFSIK